MEKAGVVKGFKVFNPDWTCINKQYTCPGRFEEDLAPSVCQYGMHFCKRAADCFGYYSFDPNNHVAEVIAYGAIAEAGDKCATDKLEIVREIPWAELLEIVNTGKGCTGLCNTGSCNSGNWNSGNWNSGSCNSGNWNSGSCNSGNWNSGNWNSGRRNSGNWNSGDCNSGDWNNGDCNSGDWNKCSFSNGCFNTASPKIYLFNKPSKWTYPDWWHSEARRLLRRIPGAMKYISFPDMTSEERAAHPEAEITGGYLRELNQFEAAAAWWRSLSDHEKAAIMAIPNFDPEIFREITGIDVKEEAQ